MAEDLVGSMDKRKSPLRQASRLFSKLKNASQLSHVYCFLLSLHLCLQVIIEGIWGNNRASGFLAVDDVTFYDGVGLVISKQIFNQSSGVFHNP